MLRNCASDTSSTNNSSREEILAVARAESSSKNRFGKHLDA